MNKQYQQIPIEVKEVNKNDYTLEAIFSTADEDRHGEIVRQNFELDKFIKNPVLLNSHRYDDAADVIGKIEPISSNTGKLEGRVKFAVAENPKAKVIFDLYAGKFLNAFSIGFIPKEFDDDGNITKSELLEISAVSVPANAMALAKSKGIDVDKLEQKGKIIRKQEDEHGVRCLDCNKELKDEEVFERKFEMTVVGDIECDVVELVCEECLKKGEPIDDLDNETEEKKVDDVIIERKPTNKKRKALERIEIKAKKKRDKELRIIKESLAVTRKLESRLKVGDTAHKKQMANRVIRQMLKIK